MEEEYERSLVAWANTFNFSSFPTCPAPATSVADFASGDALIPIAQAIVGHDKHCEDGKTPECAALGWTSVISHMHPAGLLLEENADLIEQAEDVAKGAMAVTCLEALLRHSVGEQCNGREAFIRQIMSLDAAAQTTLKHIIVGSQDRPQHEYEDESGAEAADSPSRESIAYVSFAESPAPDAGSSLTASTPDRHGNAESSYGGDSNSDDRSFNSWFSPHAKEDTRERRMAGTPGGDRAAPVGPKRQRVETDMDTAAGGSAEVVGGGGGADCCALPLPTLPASVGGAEYAAVTAMEVRRNGSLNRRARAVSLRARYYFEKDTGIASAVDAKRLPVRQQRSAFLGRPWQQQFRRIFSVFQFLRTRGANGRKLQVGTRTKVY